MAILLSHPACSMSRHTDHQVVLTPIIGSASMLWCTKARGPTYEPGNLDLFPVLKTLRKWLNFWLWFSPLSMTSVAWWFLGPSHTNILEFYTIFCCLNKVTCCESSGIWFNSSMVSWIRLITTWFVIWLWGMKVEICRNIPYNPWELYKY